MLEVTKELVTMSSVSKLERDKPIPSPLPAKETNLCW